MFQYPEYKLILTLINTDAHGINLVNFKIWQNKCRSIFPYFLKIDAHPPVSSFIVIDKLKYL